MSDVRPFPCVRCGQCCRNVSRHSWWQALDRGDGTCRHLDDATNLCLIYDSRPDECRIDLMYERLFSPVMSRADYHARTLEACATLAAQAASSTKRKERKMFLSFLTSAQQAAFLTLADRVIRADGRLAAEEAAILDALRREIPEPDLVPSEVETASLPETFPDRRSRVSAVLELIGIAHADGHFDETEGEVIAAIEDAFGLSQTDRASLRDWVLRQLTLVRDAEELMQAGE